MEGVSTRGVAQTSSGVGCECFGLLQVRSYCSPVCLTVAGSRGELAEVAAIRARSRTSVNVSSSVTVIGRVAALASAAAACSIGVLIGVVHEHAAM